MSLFLLLSFALLWASASAQNFLVPGVWRKPTLTLPRNVMEGMAQSVVNTLIPLFNTTSGEIPSLTADQPAYLIAAIARTDYLSGNTTFKDVVLNSMNAVFTLDPTISTIWGLAAASAFRAYNDSSSLTYAQTTWQQVSQYQIQPSDAAKGFATVVNASIPSSCNGSSVAGGVFAYPPGSTFSGAAQRPTDVDGETVGAFVALSGHLYEFTGDSNYLDAAVSGAEFLQNHMQVGPIMMDTFTVATCQELPIPAYTYITGFTIWGISILATHNSTWTPFLNTLISTSIPFSTWTDPSSGIVTEGSSAPSDVTSDSVTTCLKAVWIRSLHEAWTRMDPIFDGAIYVKSYLSVQFNALQDLAFDAQFDGYSPRWVGPAVAQLLPWGQLDALDVLNSAFAMVALQTSNATSSNSPSLSSTAASTSATASSTVLITSVLSAPASITTSLSTSSISSSQTSTARHTSPLTSIVAAAIGGSVAAICVLL